MFLFIAGVSFPFSYSKQLSYGVSRRHIYLKILRRAVILIGLGLVSTLPAIVTALLGMFTGDFVRKQGIPESCKAGYMGVASLVLLGAGLLWSLACLVNKALWSSSFVLVVGAYSLALFALFYYVIDVRGWKNGHCLLL